MPRDHADLVLPHVVITTDIATATTHVIPSGPLLPALLAGAAISGIFCVRRARLPAPS